MTQEERYDLMFDEIYNLKALCKNLQTDRDRWKARAEALDRAVFQNCNYCTLYLREKLTDDCWKRKQNTGAIDFGCKGWQFDEDEFGGVGKNNENF